MYGGRLLSSQDASRYRGAMRKVRSLAVGLLLVAPAALAGCATPAPDSLLDEYEDRAEEISAGMLDRVPGSAVSAVRTESAAQFGESGLLRPRERDAAFWTVETISEPPGDATFAEAADAIGAALEDQDRRWIAEPTIDDAGNPQFVKVYRLAEPEGEWIVQLGWTDADDDRRMLLSVQSPVTVRGTASASPPC
jgi:hypothetical protein